MKAIYFTDPHCDDYKAFSKGRDRLEDTLRVLDDVFALARKKQSNTILLGGDLYNTVTFIYTTVVDAVIDRLDKLFKKYPEITIYAITGNHDFATKNLLHKPTKSALRHLTVAFPGRFVLIDNERVELDGNDVIICGIPNYEFPEHYQAKLQEMSEWATGYKRCASKASITLLIHQKPSGNPNPNVRIDTDVYDPLYDPFDMVLCGDIHHPKIIRDKFILGGNPLHKDLKDEGEEKGVWSLDLTDPVNTLKFHSRKGRYPEFKRVTSSESTNDPDNFIIVEPNYSSKLATGTSLKRFASNLPHAQLVENYFGTIEGGDPKLLKTGLSFLEK